MLESQITSKPRIRLVKFFINATSIGHLHGLAAVINESAKAFCKELNNLCEVGYLVKVAMQNQPKTSFIFDTSKNSVPVFGTRCHSYDAFGAHRVLKKLGIGNYANGNDSGIIEIVVVGEAK